MSEERFEVGYDDESNPLYVYDNQNDNTYNIPRIVDLLNEQQATIEQLQAQLKEKEEDEKLYANEIVELRKTNEEWLQCKNLGGDY